MYNGSLVEVMMFKCKYCGKLFITNDRHKCKFDPQNKNCFSCAHCKGIKITKKQENINIEENISFDNDDIKEEAIKELECGCGKNVPLTILSSLKWRLNCRSWKCMNEYIGKESYIKNVPCKENKG